MIFQPDIYISEALYYIHCYLLCRNWNN